MSYSFESGPKSETNPKQESNALQEDDSLSSFRLDQQSKAFSPAEPFRNASNRDSFPGLPELALSSDSAKTPQYLLAKDMVSEQKEQHTMSSRVFSWGWTFDIKDANGKSEGVVEQKVLNLRKTFEYKDENNQLKAKGQERLFSWGTKIDVYDENGKVIGGIQEKLFRGFFGVTNEYSIVDDKGKEIAKSAKLELGATDFTLTNNKGEKIATVHRPWLNFVRENWTVDILKPNEVDKRLLYMIPAYKSSADADRRAAEALKDSDDDSEDK